MAIAAASEIRGTTRRGRVFPQFFRTFNRFGVTGRAFPKTQIGKTTVRKPSSRLGRVSSSRARRSPAHARGGTDESRGFVNDAARIIGWTLKRDGCPLVRGAGARFSTTRDRESAGNDRERFRSVYSFATFG